MVLCRFDGRCTNRNCTFDHTNQSSRSFQQKVCTPAAPHLARPCSFFLRGNCTAGANCKFSHSVPNRPPAPPAKICSFFLQGKCKRGNACQFSHGQSGGQQAVIAGDGPAKRVCSFYLRGACTNGTSCKFLHEGTPDLSKPNQASRPPPAVVSKTWRDDLTEIYSSGVGDVYSIDVECVASGRGHRDRVVGRIAMVDSDCNLVYDRIVNPKLDGVTVVSYLERLTGLKKEICDEGVDLKTAVEGLKEKLPNNALLVGQGIHHDIEWLSLKEGIDFARKFDIADMFKLRVKDKIVDGLSVPRYRFFSLRHTVLALMGVDMQSADHNPVDDAAFSVKLFLKYKDAEEGLLKAVRESVSRAQVTRSFADRWVVLEGVMMGADAYRKVAQARFIWKWWGERKGGKR
ncbi:hypothetical protein TrCOL_g11707 [Triparma columacea]|uniref:C3H1-type domain-containing protein n=1 Tax=Triparma columacea TaxID=722753 RepID=A0A9W7G760_9STRA|nr:hypothetical protein TrCOL_g11707 [Triparma columacea]